MRFYHIWIPHYAHVAEPLYGLLKKGRKFEWGDEHTESVRKMKEELAATPALRKAVYGKGTPIYVTVDTCPTGIGWVVNQEDDNNMRLHHINSLSFRTEIPLDSLPTGYYYIGFDICTYLSTLYNKVRAHV